MTPEDLVEIELIKRLKYRYLRSIDQKLWDSLESCFVPEATARYGGGLYEFSSRDDIMAFCRESMGATTFLSSHRCHHPEIDLVGADEATGTWALEDTVILTDFGLTIQGAAFYEDRYVKRDGEWKILHTGYKRSFEELIPRASIAGIKLTAEWWATDGRSTLGADRADRSPGDAGPDRPPVGQDRVAPSTRMSAPFMWEASSEAT